MYNVHTCRYGVTFVSFQRVYSVHGCPYLVFVKKKETINDLMNFGTESIPIEIKFNRW